MSDIINKWNVLQNLSKNFVSKIKSVYIYGTNGKQVIVITNDDNVYSFGDNDSNGCLGLGHTNAVQEPTKIEELCGKQVRQIEFSAIYRFVMALTMNGNVYSWGCNEFGELGIGNTTSQSKPVIINILNDNNVIDIKSTVINALLLTSFGDVYICGYNQDSNSGHIPKKMSFVATNEKIQSISTGNGHALALTNNGNVYYWGNNKYGQCGNGSNDSSFDTKWCESQNTTDLHITKIVCGPQHSIILSTKGIIYCFGDNEFGQCGDGTNVNKNIPTKANINARIIDIAATKHYDISVCLSDNGFCYIWGECGENSCNNPIKILCNNMNEVLQNYSLNRVTLKPILFTNKDYKSSSIMNRIGNKFNNREHSDIAFKVENMYIYAQKTHLSNVCKHFETMFSDNKWIESNKSEIETYSVYFAFIKYLYTDCIDISSDEDAIKLIDLANCYLEEELKQLCVEIIEKSINNENVMEICCSAVKYNSNELKAYCIEYMHNKFADKTILEYIIDTAVKLIEK